MLAEVEPPLFVGVVKLPILDDVVCVHEVAWLKIRFGVDGSWIAHCKRPIPDRPLQRLPEAIESVEGYDN